jgi:hypothetical protein
MTLDELDERHKKLLALLYETAEYVSDFEVVYVEQPDGRVFIKFTGARRSQDGSLIEFNERYATGVVCDLYEAGYIALSGPGSRAPDPGFEHVLDLRAMAQSVARPGEHKIPLLQITDRGSELVERNFK